MSTVSSVVLFYTLGMIVAGGIELPHKRLTELFKTDQNLLVVAEERIKRRGEHLLIMKSKLDQLTIAVSSRSHKEQHITNPLNNLALIRRLTSDWIVITNMLGNSLSLLPAEIMWPSEEDLDYIIRSLARLQLTYILSTKDLAQGRVQGVAANATINGDSAGSMSLLNTLLRDFPDYEPSPYLLPDWNIAASAHCWDAKMLMADKSLHLQSPVQTQCMKDKFIWLCSGGHAPQPGLRCRYVHYNKTYLRLGPFRVEELQLDPPVLLFVDVISDAEIKEIKNKGFSDLVEGTIISDAGSPVVSYHRTSETGWILRGQSVIVDNLAKRMADITNLDTSETELNQVSRYGVGGEYLAHIDFFGSVPPLKFKADRLATLMFYLSDVARGGNTVFLEWQVSVKPQKGSAVFWFNLHRNGTPDWSSYHAGCPVLEGTKWVMNNWFNMFNNDFTTSCLPDQEAKFKYFYI